jgi:SAM-dependent methyltransferase
MQLPEENIYGHTKKLKFILKNIEEYKKQSNLPIKILDFGCGNGEAVTKYLIQSDTIVYGIDIHDESIEYAKNKFSCDNAIFQKDLPSNVEFDVIVYADVLEHLENPLKFLREHFPLLKKGGIVLGSLPNGYGPFEIEKKITKYLGMDLLIKLLINFKRKLKKSESLELIPYNEESGHVNFFTLKKLRKLFEDAGYKVEKIENGPFIGAPMSERFIKHFNSLIKFNVSIGEKLPHWLVSTWYFKLIKGNK